MMKGSLMIVEIEKLKREMDLVSKLTAATAWVEGQQITINISTLEGKEPQAILLNTVLKPLLSEHVAVAVSFDIPRLSQLFGGKAHLRASNSL